MQISPDILVYVRMYYKIFFLLCFLLPTINKREIKTAFFAMALIKIATEGNYMLEKDTFISNTLNSYT